MGFETQKVSMALIIESKYTYKGNTCTMYNVYSRHFSWNHKKKIGLVKT